jgi:hypothetical protein
MIANIMIASDMMNIIMIVINTIITTTSILIDTTRIMIINCDVDEPFQSHSCDRSLSSSCSCSVSVASCTKSNNGRSTTTMSIFTNLMVLHHLLHTRGTSHTLTMSTKSRFMLKARMRLSLPTLLCQAVSMERRNASLPCRKLHQQSVPYNVFVPTYMFDSNDDLNLNINLKEDE